MTHILVDTANTFFRARHVVRGDLDTKVGMAFHITLGSIRKAWADFEGAHVVFSVQLNSDILHEVLPITETKSGFHKRMETAIAYVR